MMTLENTAKTNIAEAIAEFSDITGLKTHHQEAIAEFLQKKKPNVYYNTFKKSLQSWAAGEMPHIKRPFNLTVDFISFIISAYMTAAQDANRQRNTFENDGDKITDEQFRRENSAKAKAISMEHFQVIQSQYIETFYKSNNRLISLFALELCCTHLIEEGLDPNIYSHDQVETMETKLLSWDKTTRLQTAGVNYANVLPTAPKTNTKKAAIAALYIEENYKMQTTGTHA